jgi:serine/threonine-protein kinase RIM15
MLKDWKKKEKEEKKARKKEEKEEKKALKEAKKNLKGSKSSLGVSATGDASKRATKDSSPASSTPSSPSRSGSSTTPPLARAEPPLAGPQFHTSPNDLFRTLADAEERGGPSDAYPTLQRAPLHPELSPSASPGPVRDPSSPQIRTMPPTRVGTHVRGSETPPPKTRLSDFRIIQLIGKGGFGEVYLVEHIEKKKKYALKVLDKSMFVDESKMQQVYNERAVLVKSFKSPFLLSLSYSFHDEKYLYFAMKYCPGGDLRALLSAIGAFEEEEARLYMAEMIVSVDALHRLGYIHRDLKPDNFLIDARGHLVLADFGLSKAIWESSRKSMATQGAPSAATSVGGGPMGGNAMSAAAPGSNEHARNRSLSTILEAPVPASHSKAPSILLGPQDLVTLNAMNVDSRFIRRRRRDANASDMTGSFNPMTHSYTPSSSGNDPFGSSTVGAVPMSGTAAPTANQGIAQGGFSFEEPSFGTSSYMASTRMSVIFDSDNPMSSSYNPMTGTFSPQSVRPVIQFSDLPTKAQQRRLMAYSVVGSPDYMSPEVLAEHGYGEEVDWWSIGCLCFELVLGIPPFTGHSIQEVFDNIANWETRLPQILEQYSTYLSPVCFNLLSQLLTDPSKRLGKNGISEIKKHPFFEGLDWDNLFDEEPPFVPRLQSEEDTSYFEANVINKQQSFLQMQ